MIIWPFRRLFRRAAQSAPVAPAPVQTPSSPKPKPNPKPNPWKEPSNTGANSDSIVRRHFYNERGFQTYASFFSHWGGWITAGHCLTEAAHKVPPFTRGEIIQRPGGLDAALIGCTLPNACPAPPRERQKVIIIGYPAGSDVPARRKGFVYIQRPGMDGQWIAHIETPDEPVVTGMSGGAVMDAASGAPIGIIITRNSPADLNNDRDPDESCDFTALDAVWHAAQNEAGVS